MKLQTSLTSPDGYKTLVRKVARELSEIEFFVKRRTAQGYWTIGKYIHEHLLAREKRAEHGTAFYEGLAKDVDRDSTTLQRSVQFYRTYPILADQRELTWDHYKRLMTIKDELFTYKAYVNKIIEGKFLFFIFMAARTGSSGTGIPRSFIKIPLLLNA